MVVGHVGFYKRVDGRMEGREDGRTGGWKDGRMEGGAVTGADQLSDVPVASHLAGRDLLHRAVDSVEESLSLVASGHGRGLWWRRGRL